MAKIEPKAMDRHPSRPDYVRVNTKEASGYAKKEYPDKAGYNYGWACFDCFDAEKRLATVTDRACEHTCGAPFVWVRYSTAVLIKLEGRDEP